jgi:hypothetical protein
MHGTRLPLRMWFWAAYLVSTFHPGISAKQLQRQLAIGCHETAWVMLHKLRGAMVAPERELLRDEVEIDELYLGGYEEGLKGSHQRGKKALVGVAIEVRGRGSWCACCAVYERLADDAAQEPLLNVVVDRSRIRAANHAAAASGRWVGVCGRSRIPAAGAAVSVS